MTRDEIEADVRILENIRESALDQSWFGHEVDALTHAIEALKSSLARLDGPPPGHVRVKVVIDVDTNGQWLISYDGASLDGMRRSVINADLPLPEPAAEVEGEVE